MSAEIRDVLDRDEPQPYSAETRLRDALKVLVNRAGGSVFISEDELMAVHFEPHESRYDKARSGFVFAQKLAAPVERERAT